MPNEARYYSILHLHLFIVGLLLDLTSVQTNVAIV